MVRLFTLKRWLRPKLPYLAEELGQGLSGLLSTGIGHVASTIAAVIGLL
jgi:hypothetical protein